MQRVAFVRTGGTMTVQPFLSGAEIAKRMRINGHTIRSVAARYQLTLKRVREVRAGGVTGALLVQDWLDITGETR